MFSLRYNRFLILIIVILLIMTSLTGCGNKQSSSSTQNSGNAADFFKNKNLTFIVPYTAGGGFDAYARMLAPFIQKYISGVTVVVKNVPGAGSIVGTNQVYLEKPDGLTIGIINVPGMVFSQVTESEGVKFDLGKFTWLARVSSEPHILAMNSKSEYKSIDALKKAQNPVKISFTGVGSDDYYGAIVLFKALNVPLDLIAGYNGSHEASLAAVRGEVDGTQATLSTVESLLTSKDLIPILQLSNEKVKELTGVPSAEDVVEGSNKDLVKAITNIFTLDRCIVGPPDMPKDIAKILREALDKALNDPEFVQTAQKAKRPVNPLKGEEIEPLIKDTMSQANGIKDILKEALKK
ncbi:MAG TPA: tripartite tricarboxylate transporter substrate binding protein [Thermoanaerobacterales bacterium]|nr:tripartite tricarboxylate transporter substrate binding protein [Thermoanaerobacterales bacterium]